VEEEKKSKRIHKKGRKNPPFLREVKNLSGAKGLTTPFYQEIRGGTIGNPY
jgi:hypothetical protein